MFAGRARGGPALDVSLELGAGRLLAVCGPSGAGKTTLLRMLAGLTRPRNGRIEVDGRVWDADGVHVPPQERGVGMVFQDYALFPHMTVRENLAFAAEAATSAGVAFGGANSGGTASGGATSRIEDFLDVFDLRRWQDQKPAHLSGGQRQRVALARALARQPRLLLLDEPLSAQDGATRKRLGAYLKQVHRAENLTTVLVSHSAMEVRGLADDIMVLEEGRAVLKGLPEEVFRAGGDYDGGYG